jgi:hypothetical protein
MQTGQQQRKHMRVTHFGRNFHPLFSIMWCITKINYTPLSESASEIYRPSERRLSEKLARSFAYRQRHVVAVTDLYDRNLDFLQRSRYYFFQVAPILYLRGWVDPLLLGKFGRAENRTRTSGSIVRNSEHQTTEAVCDILRITLYTKQTRGKKFQLGLLMTSCATNAGETLNKNSNNRSHYLIPSVTLP